MDEAEQKKVIRDLMERASAGDKYAQAAFLSLEHGDDAGDLYLRAIDGDGDASVRFLSRYHEKYRMTDEEVDHFLDYTERAEHGDLDAIRDSFQYVGVPDIEAAMERVRGGTDFMYLVLLHSLDSDDPMQRTIARRSLEKRGWDEEAYGELAGEVGA
jgi:hypothetical protein